MGASIGVRSVLSPLSITTTTTTCTTTVTFVRCAAALRSR
jgi:hypothetical protein